MIARVKNAPKPSQDIDAMICWMTNEPLRPRQKLAIKHTTRTGRALIKDIQYRLDVNTLHRDQETKELGLNEIGRVQLRTTVPLLCDPYSKNRTTGSFILIDEATGRDRRRRDDQQRPTEHPAKGIIYRGSETEGTTSDRRLHDRGSGVGHERDSRTKRLCSGATAQGGVDVDDVDVRPRGEPGGPPRASTCCCSTSPGEGSAGRARSGHPPNARGRHPQYRDGQV